MCSAHNVPRRGQLVGRRSNHRAVHRVPQRRPDGTYEAARGLPTLVNLPPATADQLAWYECRGEAGRFGTFGPRGWNCFVTIGPNGWTVYVAPELLDSAKLLEHRNWKGFRGPAIQLSGSDGGTSGRFEVAKVVARVFPAHRDYARSIISEGFGPPQTIPLDLFHPTTSPAKARISSNSPHLLTETGSARRPGSCRPTSRSPSDPKSTRNFYTCVSAFRPRFPSSLRSPSSKPKQMPQANLQRVGCVAFCQSMVHIAGSIAIASEERFSGHLTKKAEILTIL